MPGIVPGDQREVSETESLPSESPPVKGGGVSAQGAVKHRGAVTEFCMESRGHSLSV